MELRPEDIGTRAQIGFVGSKPVYEVVTKGGFHLVLVRNEDRGFTTLGTGPHRAVARFIARKRRPDLKITELNKSADLDESCFRHLLPQYEELTDRFNHLAR